MKSPLDGIVVLDLTRVLSGPMCCVILEDLGAELLLSEDRRNDLTQYMIESIMEYGSLEDRIRSDTEKTGTSVFCCGCRHDPQNTTYCLQIFRKISSCCCTQVQTRP